MKKVLNVILVLISMIALLLDKSSSFEIILVGILYLMLFEKYDNLKFKK